ncbi:hypothetical protein Ddye_021833 [Dipteronia dyeriana]|uniref:Reverse transcriptase zinc-binding domain-containing protein n=1 Tax=Dipteronia dyeriana TaxID=168575 RepID=A0AAD9WXX0_9ROSI|nr:hypothetical protein Ddye_021833 [Dipteronia dyeriana]
MPSKIKIFVRRACYDWIPTMSNLGKMGIAVNNVCPICKLGEETTIHALWTCNKAKVVQKEWMSRNAKRYDGHGSFFELISDIAKHCNMEDIKVFCIVCWRLWGLRNDFVHNGGIQPYREVWPWSHKYAIDCKVLNKETKQRGMGDIITEPGSRAPECGFYKVNCSAIGGRDGNKIGIGVLIQNYRGEPCIYESDKTLVVNRISDGELRLASYCHILDEINMLKKNYSGMSFRATSKAANRVAHWLAKLEMDSSCNSSGWGTCLGHKEFG